jgi:RNA polymerase sigma factor (TIGR02999 family)
MTDQPALTADAAFAESYDELRRLAHARLAGSGALTLLDTTALVHESWLRTARAGMNAPATREKFFAYAAQVMRSVIVDTVRTRLAERRGAGDRPITLNTDLGENLAHQDSDEAVRIHEALLALEDLEPRLVRVVEMRYFAGLTELEIAATLGVTERTVRRDWEKARVLLADMLRE